MTAFDVAGPLPTGTTVLEASAGTGKTYTIAALTARYIAEGTPLERILLVTFGRLAAGELRTRVRERLMTVAADLADPKRALGASDEVSRLLATGAPEVVEARRQRLLDAIAGFDRATIATTHTFAGEMLRGLGMAADVDPGVAFTDDIAALVEQITHDLYVRAFAPWPGGGPEGAGAPFDFSVAKQIAQAAADPSATIVPADAPSGSPPARRVGLARAVRAELALRKQRLGVQGFDDLLVELRDALADPEGGAAACDRLRSRYDVVMVDEFQDTDPVQWELLQLAFDTHRTLILIGDPKQAIYAFRGGDVFTYLAATEAASAQATLATNWRTDEPLLRQLDAVMGGLALGDERIRVTEVHGHHSRPRLAGAPSATPLRVRVVSAEHVPRETKNDLMRVPKARRYVAMDVARDIARLLHSEPRYDGQPLRPGDVAVLVCTNPEGAMVREELAKLAVPAVLASATSVFTTQAAQDWLTLLRAIEQPHRRALVRAAALTCFIGWGAGDLARADEAALDEHASRLRAWASLWHEGGTAALLEAVSTQMTARVLTQRGGERVLTDVRHIGQVLDTAQRAHDLGPAATVAWLRDRILEAATDGDEERSRRLDSDADAVQIVTIHRSKGLEFAVTYVPFLWNRFAEPLPELLLFHDADGVRFRDVGGQDGEDYAAHLERHRQEDLDEALRLAYVGLTRAKSQVVTWWAPSTGTESAPLHRMLFGPSSRENAEAESGVLPLRVPVPADPSAHARLEKWLPDAAIEAADLAAPQAWSPPMGDAAALELRTFDRDLDTTWTRTSYSSLTADLHDAGGLGAEAGGIGKADEPQAPVGSEDVSFEPGAGVPSPMRDLPVGAEFGTLVHSVFERLDFTSPDLRAALTERCAAEASGVLAGVEPEALARALEPAVLTSLGPLADGRRLADFAPRDVLAEMEYEFPLAGGDLRDGRRHATVDQIADLLETHLAADDPLRDYAQDLRVEGLRGRPLRGFIGGFLDVVLRIHRDGQPRYLVVDYKTNWLGPRDRLTSASYTREAMADAMRHAHYPLQALLYSVALHRFLRWRQPGYDPQIHLGGSLYLFVRGMCGPQTPEYGGMPAGVFGWETPAALIEALSDLIDGGRL